MGQNKNIIQETIQFEFRARFVAKNWIKLDTTLEKDCHRHAVRSAYKSF